MRVADHLTLLEDTAIDVIDETPNGFRQDTRATEEKRIHGGVARGSRTRLKPNGFAVLLGRLQVLFDRASRISEADVSRAPCRGVGLAPTAETVAASLSGAAGVGDGHGGRVRAGCRTTTAR